MIAETSQEITPVAPLELKADRVSVRGRVLTIVVFGFVIVLLVLTFGWIGARRINIFFSNRGDQAMQLQDFQAARGDYTWAIRLDRSDAHAYLNRGYALQNLNNDERALRDFSHYNDLRPAEATVIEDTEAGVAAAKAAGMRCLGLVGTMRPKRLAAADELVDALDVALIERLLDPDRAARPSRSRQSRVP